MSRGRRIPPIEMTPSKVYPNAAKCRSASYWDYSRVVIEFGDIQTYSVFYRIGRGKYSDVFYGSDDVADLPVVIKSLKPVREEKIRREYLILRNLRGCSSIVSFIEAVKDQDSKVPSFIFEYMVNEDTNKVFQTCSLPDLQNFMQQILKGLDYCHSKGIMHRDIKPQNLIVNTATKQLKIIDWGLAEFYFPKQSYNVRVASRYFKGPELLVNDTYYDYSLDLWSVGCVFAGVLFRREPFFQGADNFNQLEKIIDVLGTEDFYDYLNKYCLKISISMKDKIGKKTKRNFRDFSKDSPEGFCTDNSIRLLESFLRFDRQERITAKAALEHPFFMTSAL